MAKGSGGNNAGSIYGSLDLDNTGFKNVLSQSERDMAKSALAMKAASSVKVDVTEWKRLTAQMGELSLQAQETRLALLKAPAGSAEANKLQGELKGLEHEVRLLKSATEPTTQEFKRLAKAQKDVASAASEASGKLRSVGTAMTVALTAPLLMMGKTAMDSYMRMDSLRRGMEAITGSADKAKLQMAQLQEVAKLPGLGLEEAIQGSVNLQAAGMSAKLAQDSLMAFGNALATVGKGKADLEGVQVALAQIMSKGKVQGDEILQLMERVPQIGQIMKEAFGTANTEELKKMGITATEFVTKVVAELGKLPMVTGGVRNDFENLQDAGTRAFAALGQAIAPVIGPAVQGLTSLASAFVNSSAATKTLVAALGGIAAAAGPALIALSYLPKVGAMIVSGWETLASTAKRAWDAVVTFRKGIEGLTIAQAISKVVTDVLSGPGGWLKLVATAAAIAVGIDLVTSALRGSSDAFNTEATSVDGAADALKRYGNVSREVAKQKLTDDAARAGWMVSTNWAELKNAAQTLTDTARATAGMNESQIETKDPFNLFSRKGLDPTDPSINKAQLEDRLLGVPWFKIYEADWDKFKEAQKEYLFYLEKQKSAKEALKSLSSSATEVPKAVTVTELPKAAQLSKAATVTVTEVRKTAAVTMTDNTEASKQALNSYVDGLREAWAKQQEWARKMADSWRGFADDAVSAVKDGLKREQDARDKAADEAKSKYEKLSELGRAGALAMTNIVMFGKKPGEDKPATAGDFTSDRIQKAADEIIANRRNEAEINALVQKQLYGDSISRYEKFAKTTGPDFDAMKQNGAGTLLDRILQVTSVLPQMLTELQASNRELQKVNRVPVKSGI